MPRSIARRAARIGGSALALGALSCLLALTPAVSRAQADSSNHLDLGVGVHVGTLGGGVEVNKLIFGHLGVRGEFNYFSFSLNHSISDVQYSAKLRLETIPVLLDLYPWSRGPFHVTGGVVFNQTQLTGSGVPDASGTIKLNGDSYTEAQVGVLSAAVKYPSSGGYFGLGFGTPARKSAVSFTFDVGAILSKPTVSLSATNPGEIPALTTDLAAQQASTQTSVNKVRAYPVISTGILVRF